MDTLERERDDVGPGGLDVQFLIVDDDPSVCRALIYMLKHKGLSAQGVLTAEQAVSCLSTRYFDCIVADLELPGADGLSLLRFCARYYPHMRRIMVSGSTRVDPAEVEREGICHRFLVKPCTQAEVLSALHANGAPSLGLLAVPVAPSAR